MEVDLLCADSRVVVEIDGAQHLADPVAYRRDRRKDQLLQENGYLVLRYLAEDLAKELDSVLDGILRSLSSRRARGGPDPYPQHRARKSSVRSSDGVAILGFGLDQRSVGCSGRLMRIFCSVATTRHPVHSSTLSVWNTVETRSNNALRPGRDRRTRRRPA